MKNPFRPVKDLLQKLFKIIEKLPSTTSYLRLDLSELKPLRDVALTTFIAKLTDKGLSDAITHHDHALISRSLGQAVKWNWIDKNVAKLASPPNARRSVAVAPTPEELGQILVAASKRSPQLAAVFALCALAGARRGKALALRWSEYDSAGKKLTIARSLGCTPRAGIYEKPTKTHGIRKIGIDETLEGVIFSQIKALKKNLELGFELVPDPFLFFGEPDGLVPLHPDTPSKFFRTICDSLCFPCHLHQLRHFTRYLSTFFRHYFLEFTVSWLIPPPVY